MTDKLTISVDGNKVITPYGTADCGKVNIALGAPLAGDVRLLAAVVRAGVALVARQIAQGNNLAQWLLEEAKKARRAELEVEHTRLTNALCDILQLPHKGDDVKGLGTLRRVSTEDAAGDTPRVRLLKAQLAVVEADLASLGD